MSWQPSASADALKLRARLLQSTREFFALRGVLEVQTPLLSRYAISTPEIDSFATAGAASRFLRTSPELAHKRLLAAGCGDLYELGHVFRCGEQGARHNPEFTLLEWYRRGFSLRDLMAEVAAYLYAHLPTLTSEPLYVSFQQAFADALAIDILALDQTALRELAHDRGVAPRAPLDRDQLVDLLYATCVSPAFDAGRVTFVHSYPASQAVLAQVDEADPRVALRFETFVGGLELANGFYELRDADEQRRRFDADNARRKTLGKQVVPADAEFLAALDAGLPECAGVALGFDRLVMVAGGFANIDATLAFGWENA